MVLEQEPIQWLLSNNGCNTSETVVITEADSLTSSFTTSDWNGFEVQCNGGDNGR